MKKNNFDKFQLSHTGRRETNEDRVLIHFNKKREDKQVILAVADGMGGYEKGETAAQMMIEQLKRLNETELSSEFHSLSDEVAKHIKEANRQIVELSEKAGVSQMGTTVTGALINGNRCLFFNVGDSRTYVINSLEIQKITTDHSADMDAFMNGVIGEDEIGKGYYSHALTRCIGTDKEVEVDIFPFAGFHELKEGEIIFSCSDGLWNVVKKEEIYRELIGRASLEDSLEALLALAYAKGSKDNISMAAFEYGRLPRRNLNLQKYPSVDKPGKMKVRQNKKINIMPALFIAVITVLILAIVLLTWKIKSGTPGKKIALTGNNKEKSKIQEGYIPTPNKQSTEYSEKNTDTLQNPEIHGGRIEFSPSSGTYSVNIQIELTAEQLKFNEEPILSDIYYTYDGREPTKDSKKYDSFEKISFNKPGKYSLKARLISRAGKYKGRDYSETYIIQQISTVSQKDTFTNFANLDQITRDSIFKKTEHILINVKGLTDIKKKGISQIEIIIYQDGKTKVVGISGFDVEPEEKLDEFKLILERKIQSIDFSPPYSKNSPVNAKLGIDFTTVYKRKNSDKILLER